MKIIHIENYATRAARRNTAHAANLNVGRTYPSEVYAVDFGDDEGIILMSYGTCIQSTYTAEESAHIDRMNADTPMQHGDIVQDQHGNTYRVIVRGAYSDAGSLQPIAAGGAK